MTEAEKIYKAIFKTEIPLAVNERFQKASDLSTAGYSQADVGNYHRVLSRISDLEALELAARLKNKFPLLVLKFKIMIYLAETLPENRKYYINTKGRRITGFAVMIYSGFRTMFKFIKGWILLKFLKNV